MSDDPIHIGFNGRFFPNNWRPALDEIAFAKANRFAAFQFPGKTVGLQPKDLGAEFSELHDALRDANVRSVMEIVVWVDANGVTRLGGQAIDVLRNNLPAIVALGCERVHWHFVPAHLMDDATIRALEARLVPQLALATQLAAEHDFRFGFEHNEPELKLFATPQACRMALEAVADLGFVWDMNHTPPHDLAEVQRLMPRLSMLHVSDTPLPDVNHHLPLGQGHVDFAAYGRLLRAHDYHGPAILEIGGLPKSGGYGKDTDEALIDSRRRLTQAFSKGLA